MGRTGIEEHCRADVARVGAADLSMAILTADADGASLGLPGGSVHKGCGRADQHIAGDVSRFFKQGLEPRQLLKRRFRPIHLPVSGNQRPQLLLHPYPNNTLHA